MASTANGNALLNKRIYSLPRIDNVLCLPSVTNRFANALPADPSEATNRRPVYRAAYSKVRPTSVSNPSSLLTQSQ